MVSLGPTREQLATRESELVENSAAPSTNKTRACQARCYERFCNHYDFSYLPCEPPRICTYIAFLSFFVAYSSILNYLSGLSHYLKARGKEGIDYTNFHIRASLNGARRLCYGGRGKAPGIFPKDLLSIFEKLSMSSFNDLIFWSALTLAFRCLLRISNYCKSRHCLRVANVVFVKHGIVIRIVSSKTNQFREFVSEIPVYSNPNSIICPVTWIKKMLSPKQHSQMGPSQAHPGPIWGPTLPNWGPTGAHMECCLGNS